MTDFIKDTSLRKYISSVEKVRISKDAFDNLIQQITRITQTIVKQSKKLAEQDKRTTILPRDISEVVKQITGKKKLTWEELAQELFKFGPIELGNISKSIDKYVNQQKK